MKIDIIPNISNVNINEWGDINIKQHPFISYEFLNALEQSKSVSSQNGWQPQHIVLKNEENKVIGALPNYLKNHSFGEYVFDHSWADAYQNAGGSYYPKLISAIPFTPVNGPRFLYIKKEKNQIITLISNALKNLTEKNNLSSAHINFLDDSCKQLLKSSGWLERMGLQFHWENKNYKSFDEFLKRLKNQKRKMIKKERESLTKSDISITRLTGTTLTKSIWDQFYNFYLNTINRKWGEAYLTREFFNLISEKMSSQILLIVAKKNGEIIAGALNFIGEDTLYGRNWGSLIKIPFLHFELCYYQAIEFAIEKKLKFVEAGAQGPHKISRGYIAKPTYSYHYIPNQSFSNAVSRFIQYETNQISKQINIVNSEKNPYKD